MIYIYTEKKDSKDWILQNDLYFNLNTSNEEMSSNEINLIQQVDEANLTPDKHIETKYGLGTIRNLSSGCKTLLNIVKHPDKVVNVEECGPNVLKIIFTIDIKEDDKYYIAFDYVVDNQDIRNKYRMLKLITDKAEGKIIILDMICFEYLILAFDKLVAWTGTGKTDKIKIREEMLPAIENHRINLSKIDDEKTLQYFVLINSLLGKETDIALNVLTIEEPEAHLCINNTRLMVSFLKAFTDKNKTVQLFYSTHSTEFINKMNLKNVVVLQNGKAYSFADELEDEDFAYLAKNPNLDLFKLFFSKKCILFEGISEELLIRSYIDSKETLSDIEVLSFHKGLKKIMNIWKKVNEGSGNKLGIIRDYDNQSNAKKQHDKYNDDS